MNNKTKKNKYRLIESRLNKTKRLCLGSVLRPFEESYQANFKDNLVKENMHIEKQLTKLFKKSFAPSQFTPQSDYYGWINYEWIENIEKSTGKKFYVQIDNFRTTQEKVYYDLIALVQQYIKQNKSRKATQLNAVYQSFRHLNSSSILKHVHETVDTIDRYMSANQLTAFLAYINTNEVVSWGSPIVWTMLGDIKHAGIYRNYVSPPRLTFYDYEIYIDDPTDTKERKAFKSNFKSHFLKYVKRMFDDVFGQGHDYKASDVLDAEYDILTALGCADIPNEDPDMYNVVNAQKSKRDLDFDWTEFAQHLGFKEVPQFYIASTLNYMKCIMTQLNESWTTPKWRTYFIYIYLRQMIRFHKDWRVNYHEFNEKFVQGMPQMVPEEIYPVFGLSLCFNTLLTNTYIDNFHDERVIEYVHNLATDLITVFKRIIMRNTWLSPKTKQHALKKLEHIKLIVGSPKLLREDPLLNYDADDAWGNIQKVTEWRYRQMLHMEGKTTIDIPFIDWNLFKFAGTQAYVVNAFYTPNENSIYVPLGYLQKPFIDLDERGIEYNLAFIGYTLAHEMSHSLDDMGSQYDYKGDMFNWWTPEDRRKFNLKVKDVGAHYETFAAYDGITMDASLSTGENLADIAGLAICVEYLRDFQAHNGDIVPISMLSFHAFFVYVAVQGRQKIYQKAIQAQLKINPHPMNKYRTNCPLARLKLFQSIYNIQKNDKMYWPTTDTIW